MKGFELQMLYHFKETDADHALPRSDGRGRCIDPGGNIVTSSYLTVLPAASHLQPACSSSSNSSIATPET